MLTYLLSTGDRFVPREELLREVWGYNAAARTTTVETAVRRLRRKIEEDPDRPVHLVNLRGRGYQLVPPRGRALPPAAPGREVFPSGGVVLPTAPALIGRDRDLVALRRLLEAPCRLVTVRGFAGVGKTSVAGSLVAEPGRAFPGGAWFCDLSAARAEPEALAALADTFGLRHLPRPSSGLDWLIEWLLPREPALVVLDNFEQLDQDAASSVARLVREVPHLWVVVTSRHRLDLPEEQVYDLEPLAQADAEALLRARIEAIRLDRHVEIDSRVLGELARVLDRIPLALEMAASRARILPLSGLLARLASSFAVLRFDNAGRVERQHTLRQAIDWSWQLLSDEERRALVQLAVFRQGVALDVAEELLDGPTPAISILGALYDKSLVQVRPVDGGRVTLFESVRDFVLDRSAPEVSGARDRLASWAVRFAEDARRENPTTARLARALRDEQANLVEAAEWLLARGSIAALELLAALHTVFVTYGQPSHHVDLLRHARDHLRLDGTANAELSRWLAQALMRRGEAVASLVEVDRGLERCGQGSYQHIELLRLKTLLLCGQDRVPEALERVREAIALARPTRSPALPYLYDALAETLKLRGRQDEAEEAYRASLSTHAEQDTQEGAASTWNNLGRLFAERGAFSDALECNHAARRLAVDSGDPVLLDAIDAVLGACFAFMGRMGDADVIYRRLVEAEKLRGSRMTVGSTLINGGIVAVHVGDLARASGLLESALRVLARAGRDTPNQLLCEAHLLICHAGLDDLVAAELVAARLRGLPDVARPSVVRDVLSLAAGHLEVAVGRRALAAGRVDACEQRLASARRRVASVSDPDDPGTRQSVGLLERVIDAVYATGAAGTRAPS